MSGIVFGISNRLALAALATTFAALPAHAQHDVRIRPCTGGDGVQIGIESLYPPYAKHARTFYNNQLSIFNIDTIEPAAASAGLALTFAGEHGEGTCIYVGPFSSVSPVSDAKARYEEGKGLLIELKTGDYGDNGPQKPSKPLRLRVNLKTGTVTRE